MMPWEQPTDPESACCPNGCQFTPCRAREPAEPLAETVRKLQADMLFAVRHTAVLVRSSNEALRMIVNTARGQLIPPGVCTYTDGTTMEFQDIGMPQPGLPTMTMQELVQAVHEKACFLGLELA